MNDKLLKKLIREAGWSGIYTQWISPTERESVSVPVTLEQVTRFAKLVAAAESEACAKMVSDAAPGFCGGRAEIVLNTIAASIRERSSDKE